METKLKSHKEGKGAIPPATAKNHGKGMAATRDTPGSGFSAFKGKPAVPSYKHEYGMHPMKMGGKAPPA